MALLRDESTAAEIAHDLGVSTAALRAWRDAFVVAGEAALEGHTTTNPEQRIKELQHELRRRDQVIEDLMLWNRLLREL